MGLNGGTKESGRMGGSGRVQLRLVARIRSAASQTTTVATQVLLQLSIRCPAAVGNCSPSFPSPEFP